jgi:hypothetical protein
LSEGSDAPAGAQRELLVWVEKHHDHNARMNILDGTSFAVAFACIVPGTVVTSFLAHYTSNKLLLSMPVFFSNFVFALMPFAASFVSGRFASKKRPMIFLGLVQRVAWLPVILSVVLFRGRPALLLPVFLACYAVYYLFWGSTSLFWRELMGRVFHPAKQTTTMGLRESIGNIAGSVAGIGVIAVLSAVAFPANFVVLFCSFLLAYSMCLVWISRLKEAPYPAGRRESPVRHFREILELPRSDRVFRWFVVFIFLSYGSLFVGSLYTTIGIDRFGSTINPDRLAGLMTFLMLVSNSVFSLVLGRVADRWGRFWGYLPSVVFAVVLPLWAAVAHSLAGYLAVFALIGAQNSSWFIEMFATLGFAPPERRHLVIAFLSLVKIVPITLYINLGGWIAEHVSPILTLALSSVFCLASLLVLVLKLGPRWQSPARH